MIETVRVEQWLEGVLTGDAALTSPLGKHPDTQQCVYSYLAPSGAKYPLVIYSYQGGHDVRGVGPGRIMVSALYQVKVVGQGTSFVSLRPIADRLDALLQAASGTVVDGAVLMCTREQPLAYVETANGIQYRHLGGLWRIIAQ